MAADIAAITFSCRDPHEVAEFWAHALGREVAATAGKESAAVLAQTPILFRRAESGTAIGSDLHIDLSTEDLDAMPQEAQWTASSPDAGRCPGVVTGSALKRIHRDRLRGPGVVFVHLAGTHDLIADRIGHRHGHFMPRCLLQSQLDTVEPPDADEVAITIDVTPRRTRSSTRPCGSCTWLRRKSRPVRRDGEAARDRTGFVAAQLVPGSCSSST